MAATLDLRSSAERRVGSSPSGSTLLNSGHLMTTEEQLRITPSQVATDVFCDVCKVNEFRYKKHDKFVCKWCHDRLESPHLADKSDQELDEMRIDNLKRVTDTARNSVINMNNISGIGFK